MRKISLQRLLAGLLIGLTLYSALVSSSVFLIVTGLLAVAFVYLVKQHDGLKEKYHENKILKTLNENEIKNLSGTTDTFDYDPGNNYSTHIYANDLDVFGNLSLFRHINRTTTKAGKQLVISNLLNLQKDNLVIQERKEVLSELYSAIDWRQKFYSTGSRSGEKPDDTSRLALWNAQPSFFTHRKHWIGIAAILTLMTTGVIFGMALYGSELLLLLGFQLTLNTVIYQIFFRTDANAYFSRFGDFSTLFSAWSGLCAQITGNSFRSVLGKKLSAQVAGASTAFLNIANLNKLIGYRLNGMMMSIMNGLCLFDVWFILQIENWRHKNGNSLDPWLDSIHQLDFLNSFANYRFNHPSFCDPEIVEGKNHISAAGMGHPLMQSDQLVTNDFEIGISASAHIITGSNMSGKSTFLRAVGLNTVLALNGLPVCADRFSCSNLSVASCIRISDSLEENQSYFRAEINRLSQVVKLVESGRPYLVLLDEILRGTNATDKQAGTRLFFQKLAHLNCLALLATHDPEIGNLATEDPGLFQNFHFESHIIGNEIHFDYLLRPGVSVTKNATLLMKQLNLI